MTTLLRLEKSYRDHPARATRVLVDLRCLAQHDLAPGAVAIRPSEFVGRDVKSTTTDLDLTGPAARRLRNQSGSRREPAPVAQTSSPSGRSR